VKRWLLWLDRGGMTLPLALGLCCVVSALAVVRVKHENRLLTTDLDRLRVERDQLDMEWAQLQLEEAALAQHGRIDQIARNQLGMSEPRSYEVVETHESPAVAAPEAQP
jgi:cell division protein FtsL